MSRASSRPANGASMAEKITKAQLAFLKAHRGDQMLAKSLAHKSYDFVGRVRDLGLVTIHDGPRTGWPWSWEGTTLTDAGLAAITPTAAKGADHE